MRVCAIDPGIRNFAVAIEEFDHLKIHTQKDVFTNGKVIYLNVIDLCETGYNAKSVSLGGLLNLNSYLESIHHLLETCDAFVVEKQLKVNPPAQWVEHHCYAYFVSHFWDFKVITPMSSKMKYSELRYNGNRKKSARKKWAEEKACGILLSRDDIPNVQKISTSRKKDDMGDVIIMIQAFKSRIFVKGNYKRQL